MAIIAQATELIKTAERQLDLSREHGPLMYLIVVGIIIDQVIIIVGIIEHRAAMESVMSADAWYIVSALLAGCATGLFTSPQQAAIAEHEAILQAVRNRDPQVHALQEGPLRPRAARLCIDDGKPIGRQVRARLPGRPLRACSCSPTEDCPHRP